jgi:glucokinase
MAGAPSSTIIGVDVGGTKTTVVEGTIEAVILQRSERPTAGELPFADTWPTLAQQIATTVDRARAAGRRPSAISVAIGGPLVAREGRLIDPPNLPGWHGVHLAGALESRFPDLPAHLEHDAKAGALAEFHFGVGLERPALTDLVFLTFGTGLGAGIIANRRLVRGGAEMAGELWSLALCPPGGARVREIEGWEDAASGRGIAWLASYLYPARWPRGTPPRDVIDAALANDDQAMAVVAESGRWLGAGLAVLITVLNPQVIALGSLAVALGERVLGPARDEVARRTLARARDGCEIVPSALGARLGDVQSLMAALEVPRDEE